MTGYTRQWTCFICQEPQDTIDLPRSPVCHTCLTPLAEKLCRDALGPKVKYDHPAVNQEHFLREAAGMVWLLLLGRHREKK